MAKHVKRSVIPIYLVGAVWLVFGLCFRLYQPVDYLLCTLVSAAAFILGKAIFPDKSYQISGRRTRKRRGRRRRSGPKRPTPPGRRPRRSGRSGSAGSRRRRPARPSRPRAPATRRSTS